MPAIGIRAATSEIFYVIVDGSPDNPEIIIKDKLRKPKAFDLPDSLSWYRENLMGIFKEYSISACGIKVAEPFSRAKATTIPQGTIIRAHVEGVIMEAAKNFGLLVVIAPLATISSLIDTKSAKKYFKSDEFRGLSGWGNMNQQYKEATLAGIAALRGRNG